MHPAAAPTRASDPHPIAQSSERGEIDGSGREWDEAVAAMHAFFHPRSVAVIGASRQLGTISGEVLHNLLQFGFNGPVLPVNTRAKVVQSIVAYSSVCDVPGQVDLAVIVVPADHVLGVARECAQKGVQSLVVISSGFAEAGSEGRARQQELVRICRSSGMRLIGPNCMGIINTDPEVRLNATFAAAPALAGRIAFMSQSGGLGIAIMDYAGALGLGLSSFVSVGNKADVSANDLLRYWEQDRQTDLILLYLESFGNPRHFSRIARRVARTKPIIAVKGGRSPAGLRATGSHTGALIAASDVTVDALFRQARVIRTDTLEQMFDVAALLASQPPPKGRRVAVITNAGGPGILCADACVAEGLEVPLLSEATQATLRALLPTEASVSNPVDLIASATAYHYHATIEIVARDANVDAIVVIFIPPLVTKPEDVAQAIVDGTRALAREKPVLTVFMQSRGVPPVLRAADVRVPSYSFPENAAMALARVAEYGEWLARPVPVPARLEGVRREEATAVVSAAVARGGGWLDPHDVWQVLTAYGLPMLPQRIVGDADAAARAAMEMGGAVALKAIAPGLVHKTEAGAVRIGLTADQVRAAALEMQEGLRGQAITPAGFLVQQMAVPGVEMIVGVVHDRQFGTVLACGAGGVLVELVKDVAVRLTPVSELDAMEMVRDLKTWPLLAGYRGGAPHDVSAVVDAIVRVSALAEDIPEIAELDLNPILVHERHATIVDARIRVSEVTPPSA